MQKYPLSAEILEKQESEVLNKFREEFGKNKNGFCDNCYNTLDLIIQGIHYYKDDDQYDENGDFKNFNQAIRFMAYIHYLRISYSIKAIYNCFSKGYYSDAASLLRTLLETYVRLRYVYNSENTELVHKAVAGHIGWNGERFRVRYSDQFEDLAEGSYKEYQLLCDFAHGAMTPNTLKWEIKNGKIYTDKGIVYKEQGAGFVGNFFTVCLAGNLRFLFKVFPEIKSNAPQEYLDNLNDTNEFWDACFEGLKNGESQEWFEVMEPLTEVTTA